ncbi:MAG: DUF2785 domain-containing protein [Planctomycetes bacterium]|nr:DUF2785 domain-containing protein [Planctomycetota bacterium]
MPRSCWISITLALAACSSISQQSGSPHDFAAIVDAGYAPPEGVQPFDIVLDLGDLLGSTDPLERDEWAYGISAQWIVRRGLLAPDELRELALRWCENLRVGLGEKDRDSVFLRSFSALSLSLIAARDLQQPFLDANEVRALVDRALEYAARERDRRDFDPVHGWIHATAHTADWLKFLARNRHVDAARLRAMLDAVGGMIAGDAVRAYSMGEDERLARALAAVVAREELDPRAWCGFLDALVELVARTRAQGFSETGFAVEQNVLHVLRALYASLSAADGSPEHVQLARDATLRALARL